MVNSILEKAEAIDASGKEFYQLIGEGLQAIQDGRTSSIDEVRENLERRRAERDRYSVHETGRV